ncbi:MAG: 3-hydroxyacyl-CoA dehydrogenase NAD-binding domain-containing protein, partial [Gemmatimonadales bacterium]
MAAIHSQVDCRAALILIDALHTADTAPRVKAFIAEAWPTLAQLHRVVDGWEDRLSVHASPAEAVQGAAFVQESLPERLDIKHEVYWAMGPALETPSIVAWSSSGLL